MMAPIPLRPPASSFSSATVNSIEMRCAVRPQRGHCERPSDVLRHPTCDDLPETFPVALVKSFKDREVERRA
jgi:hypothetical protein